MRDLVGSGVLCIAATSLPVDASYGIAKRFAGKSVKCR